MSELMQELHAAMTVIAAEVAELIERVQRIEDRLVERGLLEPHEGDE